MKSVTLIPAIDWSISFELKFHRFRCPDAIPLYHSIEIAPVATRYKYPNIKKTTPFRMIYLAINRLCPGEGVEVHPKYVSELQRLIVCDQFNFEIRNKCTKYMQGIRLLKKHPVPMRLAYETKQGPRDKYLIIWRLS